MRSGGSVLVFTLLLGCSGADGNLGGSTRGGGASLGGSPDGSHSGAGNGGTSLSSGTLPRGGTVAGEQGGSSPRGGAGNGGVEAAAGGIPSAGGTQAAGGATVSGGAANGSTSKGGATVATVSGGTSSTRGGAASGGRATGGQNAGGAPASGGNSSTGVASSCWTGATVTWSATDYASRKWARWPIPNTPATGLPHPTSYTTSSDGILDNTTGLVWQKGTSPSTSNWADALAYCSSLGAGWTLPTRIELTTIIYAEKSGNKVDTSLFSGTAGWTWASTPWVVNQRKNLTGASALSWFINFSLGDSNNSLSQTNTGAYSRCVKIQQQMTLPAEHYTIANGEVRDNYTCLTWQQDGSGTSPSLTRDQAIAYCSGLTLNGQKWRLPSLNELSSIVDDVPTGDVSPAVDHSAFPNTSPDQKYWSMSGYGASATQFWMLNFMDGFTQRLDPSTPGNARCVR